MQQANGEDAVEVRDESSLFYFDSPIAMDDPEMWQEGAEQNMFVDANNASLFDESFSTMPEFTSVSSSSSSSCHTPAPTEFSSISSASSSSSAGSRTVLNPDLDFDSLDNMEGFLFDCNGVLDAWPMFDPEVGFHQAQEEMFVLEKSSMAESEELAVVFLEWLKTNKDSVSAEDLRNIRLNRSTVECAARRLGGGKDGTKRLLQLILQWVQQHQLHKNHVNQSPYEYINNTSVPNESNIQNIRTVALASPCSQYHHPQSLAPQSYQPLYSTSPPPWRADVSSPQHASYEPYRDLQFVEPPQCYIQHPSLQFGFPRSSSATKEARKKRMARRFQSNHMRNLQIQCNSVPMDKIELPESAGSRSYLQHLSSVPPPDVSAAPMKTTTADCSFFCHRQSTSDKQHVQRWKPEKNLRFLLQKVLKQSDVGSIGRIVLPKKEAERHLPQLEARDGITIAMEDIGSSRVWNMRYRFWPNNKSRMYLLENTGDFVRSNGLQQGDFIVIYSDLKSGKYLIRGVKVPQEFESETKKLIQKCKTRPAAETNVAPSCCRRGGVDLRPPDDVGGTSLCYVSSDDWA